VVVNIYVLFIVQIYVHKYKTPNKKYFSILFQVLINTRKDLEGSKNKKEVEIDVFMNLAPLFLERCNYNRMIEFVTIWKLRD